MKHARIGRFKNGMALFLSFILLMPSVALANASDDDIGRTILHEFGHAFGMAHPNINKIACGYISIMTPYNGEEALKSKEIMPHDKYVLVERYNELSKSAQTIEAYEPPEEFSIYRERPWVVDSEKVLEETSEYIVKGYFVGARENVEENYRGYTLADFVVSKVYKGDDIKEGSTIKVREPYYTQILDDGLEIIYRYEDYSDSLNGEEYIFFLLKRNDIFGLPNSTLSRYPVNDEISVKFSNSDDISFTEENFAYLRNEVLEKYN